MQYDSDPGDIHLKLLGESANHAHSPQSFAIVERFDLNEQGCITRLHLRDGRNLGAANFIAAVPPDRLLKMLPEGVCTDPAFTITRVWLGPAHYRFDFAADCDDSFGCVPPRLELKDSFVEYVMGMSVKIK